MIKISCDSYNVTYEFNPCKITVFENTPIHFKINKNKLYKRNVNFILIAQQLDENDSNFSSDIFESRLLNVGDTYIHTFTQEGTFFINCLLNRGLEMTIVVKKPESCINHQINYKNNNYN